MKCKSVSSENVDPYNAGSEIADSLEEIKPEVILLFPSVHYADFTDLYDGIFDVLENPDTIIFGATGDGFYETNRVGSRGVAALGINSFGKIKWTVATRTGLGEDSFQASRECAQEILDKAEEPVRLAILFSDGLTGDGVKVIEGADNVIAGTIVGGTAGDDRKFERGYVLANRKGIRDAVGILGLSGDFSFATNSASGWKPTGVAGVVEEASDNIIRQIEGMSTIDFVKEQLVTLPAEAEMGLFPLAAYDSEGRFQLRASMSWDRSTGELTVAGRVEKGTPVRVCTASIEDILSGVKISLDGLKNLDFEATGALVISCAARKWILGSKVKEETERLFSALGHKIPLAGYPSFGEIGPFRNPDNTYTDSFFHNETYILLFIGP